MGRGTGEIGKMRRWQAAENSDREGIAATDGAAKPSQRSQGEECVMRPKVGQAKQEKSGPLEIAFTPRLQS